jgi:hypothetical protein
MVTAIRRNRRTAQQEEETMTDPRDIDRIEGSDVEDVPVSREQPVERDAGPPDELPGRLSTDTGLTERADPDGSA